MWVDYMLGEYGESTKIFNRTQLPLTFVWPHLARQSNLRAWWWWWDFLKFAILMQGCVSEWKMEKVMKKGRSWGTDFDILCNFCLELTPLLPKNKICKLASQNYSKKGVICWFLFFCFLFVFSEQLLFPV